jgi:dienelactone hydrolase
MVDVTFKTVEELYSIGLCLGATPVFAVYEMKPAMNAMDAHAQDCYYPSSTHSHSALAHCTPLEMLDIFILCEAVELPGSPTSGSPVITPIASSPPHRTGHAHHPAIIIS